MSKTFNPLRYKVSSVKDTGTILPYKVHPIRQNVFEFYSKRMFFYLDQIQSILEFLNSKGILFFSNNSKRMFFILFYFYFFTNSKKVEYIFFLLPRHRYSKKVSQSFYFFTNAKIVEIFFLFLFFLYILIGQKLVFRYNFRGRGSSVALNPPMWVSCHGWSQTIPGFPIWELHCQPPELRTLKS